VALLDCSPGSSRNTGRLTSVMLQAIDRRTAKPLCGSINPSAPSSTELHICPDGERFYVSKNTLPVDQIYFADVGANWLRLWGTCCLFSPPKSSPRHLFISDVLSRSLPAAISIWYAASILQPRFERLCSELRTMQLETELTELLHAGCRARTYWVNCNFTSHHIISA